MTLNNSLLSYYKKNKIFLFAFIFSILTYLGYLIFRGFGWDGDSFISASQYLKIINRDLYGVIDGGSHPKFLTVIFFGLNYQITSGFYLLTFISIVLNALMIGTLIKWVDSEKGVWLITLSGLLINIPWTKLVINCDNPAFSIPFIVFGLYFISKDEFIPGSIFLVISNLFRSGSEFILALLIIREIFHRNPKNTLIIGMALIVSLIHSYWGYLLVYPSREIFWNNTWTIRVSSETISQYQYSIKSVVPYIQSVFKQLFTKYSILLIIPALWGTFKLFRQRNSIKLALLIPLASLILPISSFMYGVSHTILETKHMGYTILLPVLAAFSINCSILKKMVSKTKVSFTTGVLLLVILFSVFTGNLKQGHYEAHVNGTGVIGWTNFSDIKHDVQSVFLSDKINILTAYQYLTFIILDVGIYANNIDVIRNKIEYDYTTINKYDLIIIPKVWGIDSKKMSNLGYTVKSNNNNNYIHYIFHPQLSNI